MYLTKINLYTKFDAYITSDYLLTTMAYACENERYGQSWNRAYSNKEIFLMADINYKVCCVKLMKPAQTFNENKSQFSY